MPAKTNIWNKVTIRFFVVMLKDDGTVDHIDVEYLMGDTGDQKAQRNERLTVEAAPRLAAANALLTALRGDVRAQEEL